MTTLVRIMHCNFGTNRQIHAVPTNRGEAEKNAGKGVYIDPGTWGELWMRGDQDIHITEVAPDTPAVNQAA